MPACLEVNLDGSDFVQTARLEILQPGFYLLRPVLPTAPRARGDEAPISQLVGQNIVNFVADDRGGGALSE